ncbi:ferritin-like domain-containing protein [Ottowia testudinis]|uniref:Ferritin-like domain-containing protein n=1 Tax=Ottowia testudinis TaxID=2816950 RepID=A0A975CK65_9BURK|nr:ferritin-like domain-containing protein [Ottowia testudinis]
MRAAPVAPRSSAEPEPAPARRQAHWRVESLDFGAIDRARIAAREDLFYLLVSASFIESGSDLYTRNLSDHYADYPEVAAWLRDYWEHEELQHGRAFERYVKAAWPEFPWQTAFESFIAEYGPLCTMEELEPDRALELAARCVVETGTTTYYQTLRELSDEPVLTDMLGRIRADEVNHYKHFLAYFKQLRAAPGAKPSSRLRVARVVYQRLLELRESDSDVALRHVWAHKGGMFADGAQSFEEISRRIYQLVSSRLPADQAVRMLLKPLMLPRKVESWIEKPLAGLARRVVAS